MIIKAPTLNPYSSPYRNPYRPLYKNPLKEPYSTYLGPYINPWALKGPLGSSFGPVAALLARLASNVPRTHQTGFRVPDLPKSLN